jgi:hypothetical protein
MCRQMAEDITLTHYKLTSNRTAIIIESCTADGMKMGDKIMGN